jgi:hypothetical protein
MTKEEFEILKGLLEKLIDILSNNNQYMPILLVLFGALAGIIPQFVFWILQNRKEKKNKKRELLAEAYKTSQLLSDYYKELVMHKTHKNFWHQSSEYAFQDTKQSEIYYAKHLESGKESFATEFRIKNLYAEYIKTIKSFQIYNGEIEKLDEILKEIANYKPRKPKTFENIPDKDLREAAIKEEDELNKEYVAYAVYYDKINKLLEKELK